MSVRTLECLPTWTLWRSEGCQCSWSTSRNPCRPWEHTPPRNWVWGGRWCTWPGRSVIGWQPPQTGRCPPPCRARLRIGWSPNWSRSSCCRPDKPLRRRSERRDETVHGYFMAWPLWTKCYCWNKIIFLLTPPAHLDPLIKRRTQHRILSNE